ncbi:DNA polymerase epsilon subunit 2-like [Stylophora pistillata]|uniref:DNA polymerase epsilon subunit 2-like n=1 Tax=Stylophora pistillata TaxID=50429 RepID=UPI000C048FFA|nr:DNA polymerase epsilon subunit 2-like [Stylophora pistillata]
MAATVRGTIVSTFKLHGLSLKTEASKFLTEVLGSLTEVELEDWLDKIVEGVQKQPLTTSLVDRDVVEQAVQECSYSSEDDSDNVFTFIDAFSVPVFSFNPDRKKFLPHNDVRSLHAHSPNAKSLLFRERYRVLHQRTMRHELFSPVVEGANQNQVAEKFALKPVEFLLGSTANLGQKIVLGMLTQIKEGKYFLEDPSGVVELDIRQANFHTGLYTENCFVLAEGTYEDGVFRVKALGFPPAEPGKVTRNHFGNVNFFGGPSSTSLKASAKLKAIERENHNAMFVILSDVWLDQPKVMEKLRALFSGYSTMPPAMFILCGNFTSEPYGPKHYHTLKASFQAFAKLVAEFPPLIENSRFVFVPGPQDPGPGNILPRPPIPTVFTSAITEKIPMSVFTSNPSRIQYCTQEIIVFREDLVNKMCRNSINLSSDLKDIPVQLMKTILAQSHICPIPPHVRPIYWTQDHSLRVYPVPDLMILADKYDPYTCSSLECVSTNPSSFARNEFAFKVYWPSSRETEDCKISD